MRYLRLLFGLSEPVTRKVYLMAGVSLLLLKVVLDNSLSWLATGHLWSPLAYFAPSWTLKSQDLARGSALPMPTWAIVAMVVVALPFAWIGVSMSVRRAADAGKSPFVGMFFLVPIMNYAVIAVLASLPSASEPAWSPPDGSPYRTNDVDAPARPPLRLNRRVRATLLGLLASVAVGIGMIGLSIYSMQLYGAALFFGTPFVMGFVTSFAYNHDVPRASRSLSASIGFALLGVILTGCFVLLFAIEGVLCLAMAFPIAAVLASFGALLGFELSGRRGVPGRHVAACILFLPVLAGVEAKTVTPALHEVTTSIEIDAPPERVWSNVIGFAELPPPSQFYFRLGIAYPIRATIHGEGVGAVRHCEFSTGPFVEPITVWEPGRRLSFDVTAQPPSMTELSPYKDVKAAHLEGYMVSRRGEFRLVPLPGGRTRLEGSTWYTLSIFPESYWTVWGEALLHSIHGRVLAHIKHETERSTP